MPLHCEFVLGVKSEGGVLVCCPSALVPLALGPSALRPPFGPPSAPGRLAKITPRDFAATFCELGWAPRACVSDKLETSVDSGLPNCLAAKKKALDCPSV